MAKHADGEPWDPFDPGAFVPGVTSAFKRFFPPYCELQVLFDAAAGGPLYTTYIEAAAEQHEYEEAGRFGAEGSAATAGAERPVGWQAAAVPWRLMRELVALLVIEHVPDVPALKRMLRRTVAGEFDLALFRIAIHQAVPATTLLPAPEVGLDGRAVGAAGLPVALVGDAAVTAHYRLGIGVNNAFKDAAEVGLLVGRVAQAFRAGDTVSGSQRSARLAKTAAVAAALEAAVQLREVAAAARAGAMVGRQLAAIFFESRCDAVVFGVAAEQPYEVWLRDRVSPSGGHRQLGPVELRRLPCLHMVGAHEEL